MLGTLYVHKGLITGIYKVGWSSQLRKRLQNRISENGESLELFYTERDAPISRETQIKEDLKEFVVNKVNGESTEHFQGRVKVIEYFETLKYNKEKTMKPDNRKAKEVKYNVKSFVEDFKNGMVIIPEIQRSGDRWTKKTRDTFINSIILDGVVSEMVSHLHTDGRYSLINGQQRLSTLVRFMNNEFKISSINITDNESYWSIEPEYDNIIFDELPTWVQSKIENATINFIEYGVDYTAAEIAKRYVFINTGVVNLNRNEINRAKYYGVFVDLIEEYNNDEFFNQSKLITEKSVSNKNCTKLIAHIIGDTHSGRLMDFKEIEKTYYEGYKKSVKSKSILRNAVETSKINVLECFTEKEIARSNLRKISWFIPLVHTLNKCKEKGMNLHKNSKYIRMAIFGLFDDIKTDKTTSKRKTGLHLSKRNAVLNKMRYGKISVEKASSKSNIVSALQNSIEIWIPKSETKYLDWKA